MAHLPEGAESDARQMTWQAWMARYAGEGVRLYVDSVGDMIVYGLEVEETVLEEERDT